MKILHPYFLAASSVAYVNSYFSLHLFKQARRYTCKNILFTSPKLSLTRPISMAFSSSSSHSSFSSASQRDLIGSIYGNDGQPSRNVFSLYLTGGGVQSVSWLLSVPGASRSVMNAVVPYSYHALSNLLPKDSTIGHSCCQETAILMATAAYTDALSCFSNGENCAPAAMGIDTNVFGVSCTAALVSNTPKKGPHRCHVAVVSRDKKVAYSVTLDKTLNRTRTEEDELCSRLILDAIAKQSHIFTSPVFAQSGDCMPDSLTLVEDEGLSSIVENPIMKGSQTQGEGSGTRQVSDRVYVSSFTRGDIIDDICSKKLTHAVLYPRTSTNNSTICSGDEQLVEEQFMSYPGLVLPRGTIVYPGSFNPLHEGHVSLVKTARTKSRQANIDAKNAGTTTGASTENGSEEWEKKAMKETETEKTEAEIKHEALIVFEIAVVNADKPPLPREQILQRLQQFVGLDLDNYAVSITSQPLFLGKSEVFPQCCFLIGADTFSRLMDTKYYYQPPTSPPGQSEHADDALLSQQKAEVNLIQALSTIERNGCSFIVAGRVTTKKEAVIEKQIDEVVEEFVPGKIADVFETFESICASPSMVRLSKLSPSPLLGGELFTGLSEGEFRMDLSSTQIRKAKALAVLEGRGREETVAASQPVISTISSL